MKISELITELEKLKEEHGDVVVMTCENMYSDVEGAIQPITIRYWTNEGNPDLPDEGYLYVNTAF